MKKAFVIVLLAFCFLAAQGFCISVSFLLQHAGLAGTFAFFLAGHKLFK